MGGAGYTNLYGYDIGENGNVPNCLNSRGIKLFTGINKNEHYPSNYFDCIYMNLFLEHVEDPLEVLGFCHRLLKPRGVLYFSISCIDSWVAKLNLKDYPGLQFPYHLNHFSAKSTKLILSKSELSDFQVKCYGSPQYLPKLISTCLGVKRWG